MLPGRMQAAPPDPKPEPDLSVGWCGSATSRVESRWWGDLGCLRKPNIRQEWKFPENWT